MTDIQTDVTEEGLVTAIRLNMCNFFRHLSRRSPAGGFEDDGRFTCWHTPLPHPWFNGVLSSTVPEENDAAFITEIIQYFGEKQVRTFTWWMEPHLHPSDWEAELSRQGFGFSNDTPGMAVDLHELGASPATVPGLEVRPVSDAALLRTWAGIFTKGYGLPTDWSGLIFELWMKLGLDGPLRNYLGYLNGEPVSTSSIFNGGGVAGIYDVSTLPAARGRGIGAVLTLRPLLEAREMGYRIGILQSSDMGYNVYKRLGFRHVCQIENFYRNLQ